VANWLSLFAVYRVVVIRSDEVTQGILHPELGPDHPAVRTALADWEGTHFLHQSAEGIEVTLVRPLAPRRAERWWLHALLALATLFTTTAAGAYFAGRDPFRVVALPLGAFGIPLPVGFAPDELLPGLAFSVPLFAILLGHELGHYLLARRHGMDVSPPYFIPSPPFINFIGTFGAFIRLRSAMVNRTMLLDVGAAGPIVSFVLSVPAVLVGASWSRWMPIDPARARTPFLVFFGDIPIWLGGSPLFDALVRAVGAGEGVLVLHPLAFAGWLGLFVTALNLFPLAQLDGGHVLFALVGTGQRWLGLAFLAVLLVLGTQWWGWWMWAGLILLLGRGSVRHPSVFDPEFPVSRARRVVGWATVALFPLTFVAVPIQG
jgi:hypothetical protein